MAEMSAEDFAAWRAAYDYEPWGEERADLRAAVGHAIADSARQKQNPRPYKDYMPFYREPEEEKPAPGDPDVGMKIWHNLAAAWRKAASRNKAATQPRKKRPKGGRR